MLINMKLFVQLGKSTDDFHHCVFNGDYFTYLSKQRTMREDCRRVALCSIFAICRADRWDGHDNLTLTNFNVVSTVESEDVDQWSTSLDANFMSQRANVTTHRWAKFKSALPSTSNKTQHNVCRPIVGGEEQTHLVQLLAAERLKLVEVSGALTRLDQTVGGKAICLRRWQSKELLFVERRWVWAQFSARSTDSTSSTRWTGAFDCSLANSNHRHRANLSPDENSVPPLDKEAAEISPHSIFVVRAIWRRNRKLSTVKVHRFRNDKVSDGSATIKGKSRWLLRADSTDLHWQTMHLARSMCDESLLRQSFDRRNKSSAFRHGKEPSKDKWERERSLKVCLLSFLASRKQTVSSFYWKIEMLSHKRLMWKKRMFCWRSCQLSVEKVDVKVVPVVLVDVGVVVDFVEERRCSSVGKTYF